MPEGSVQIQWIISIIGIIVLLVLVGVLILRQRPGEQEEGTGPVDNQMHQRAQLTAEQILDDASLTDEMSDPEASRVIEWAVGVARQLAEQTSGLDDAQARQVLDEQAQNLRKVVRRINGLVGSLSAASPEDISDRLGKIAEAASQVPVLAADSSSLQAAAPEMQNLSPQEAVSRILSQLHKGVSDDETQA